MSDSAKFMPYARETAICVDLAYDSCEGDLRAELEAASGPTAIVLNRIVEKIRARREVLEKFTTRKVI